MKKCEWTEAQRKILKPFEDRNQLINVLKTLARHPMLAERFLGFSTYIYSESTLPPRDREIAILRIGWLCKAEYEWSHHVTRAREAGLTEQEICRITEGVTAEGWSALEATLLLAVDELYGNAFICDETWKSLMEHYTEEQLMDFVFTVGEYNLLSMALNSFGVPLDEGMKGFPENSQL